MNNLKVIRVSKEVLYFTKNVELTSGHEQDCCETHYLDFSDLGIGDFDNLEFDFTNDNFFRKIEGYGIELVPIKGYSVRIPGYGCNNGYYGTDLQLVINGHNNFHKEYDISECQEISD